MLLSFLCKMRREELISSSKVSFTQLSPDRFPDLPKGATSPSTQDSSRTTTPSQRFVSSTGGDWGCASGPLKLDVDLGRRRGSDEAEEVGREGREELKGLASFGCRGDTGREGSVKSIYRERVSRRRTRRDRRLRRLDEHVADLVDRDGPSSNRAGDGGWGRRDAAVCTGAGKEPGGRARYESSGTTRERRKVE